MKSRIAFSLLELLVVISLIGVLLALLLPAIQSARLNAQKTAAMNLTKQILLANQHYSVNHLSAIPSLDGTKDGSTFLSPIEALCPYLDTIASYSTPPAWLRFRSDPSWGSVPPGYSTEPPPPPPFGELAPEPDLQVQVTSFAFNALVFTRDVRIDASITDGLSSTVAVTEHYAICDRAVFNWRHLRSDCLALDPIRRIPCDSSSVRRASFADHPMYSDVYPVSSNSPQGPLTTGNLTLTFQVRPSLKECDPRIPQSSLPGGLLCGMIDGSVRTMNPNVHSNTFWASITPNSGEIISLD